MFVGLKSTVSSAALAVALVLPAGSVAIAADLGGNCCADLEERIAELEATTARKGNRKVSLEISGWLNRTILFWDDGIRSDVYAGIDNDAASSRWRFTGTATITPDVRAGFVYEFGNHGTLTSAVDQSNGGDDRGFGLARLRQANVWLESKRVGRVTLGVASQATDGIAEIDLSRTEAVSGSSVDSWIASFKVNRNGVYDGFSMYEHFPGNFDGGRDQLIRYDSPTIAGFILSASISGGTIYPEDAPGALPPVGDKLQEWDIALRYAGEWNGFRFAAGVGYHQGIITDSTQSGGTGAGTTGVVLVPHKNIVGSTSLLHMPTGLFFTAAAGHLQFEDNVRQLIGGAEMQYMYLKGGLLRSIFSVGQTSIYGEYYRMDKDIDSPADGVVLYPGVDSTSHMWGVGVVQHIDAAAMELYAAYRFYDTPDGIIGARVRSETGDFHMLQIGTRIKF